MHKKMLIGFMAVLLFGALAMGLVEGQPRPYSNLKAGCDTSNSTVAVGVGFDAWYFYCWLDDSASGTGTLTRYWNSSAVETCSIILRPGAAFISFTVMDSFRLVKTGSSDIFCYEVAR